MHKNMQVEQCRKVNDMLYQYIWNSKEILLQLCSDLMKPQRNRIFLKECSNAHQIDFWMGN